jgi:four helix bundle protein
MTDDKERERKFRKPTLFLRNERRIRGSNRTFRAAPKASRAHRGVEEGLEKIEAYGLSYDLAIRIHRMTLTLPHFELYEEGSQVRRSSKRVSACIVEGFTLRKYKALYLNFLYRGLASSDETQLHLKFLQETGSMTSDQSSQDLLNRAQHVSGKLFSFICSVEQNHQPPRYLDRLAGNSPPDPI